MKKRVLTGTVYVILLIGLVAMHWLVPGGWGALGFDALFTAVSVIGCIELLNALKEISLPQKAVTIAFCAVIVPLYAAVEIAMGQGWLAAIVCALVYALVISVFHFTGYEGSDTKGTLNSLFAMGYCGVLSCILSAVNHLSNATPAIILLFLAVSLTDCIAFLVGSVFKRWVPYKLAPKISPNKTVIGGVGGIIGGVAGAIASYFIYYGFGALSIETVTETVNGAEKQVSHLVSNFAVDGKMLVWFVLIGFIVSIAAQAGDLFESYIKRRCGIKDMGKLLPGHGGVLDRFDSVLFSGLIVLLGFILIAL